MNTQTERIFEAVDAALFSGDTIYTDFAEVKEYVERWARLVKAQEETNERGAG